MVTTNDSLEEDIELPAGTLAENDASLEAEDEMYEHYRVTTDKKQEPLRIDKFLFNRIEKSSKGRRRL